MARRGAALRTGAGSGTFLLVLLVAAGGFLKDSAPVGVRAQGDGTAGARPVYEYEDDYDPSAVRRDLKRKTPTCVYSTLWA